MSEEQNQADEDGTQRAKQMAFHYIKSQLFRVIHADGAWGGVTPSLNIHMALFSERSPIPQQVVHTLSDKATLGPEVREERITRRGVVREVEVDVIMSPDTAKSLITWLEAQVKIAESRFEDSVKISQGQAQ